MEICNRLQYVINLKTKKNKRPEKIFINEKDFKQFYEELLFVNRDYTHANANSEYENLYFSGVEICLSKEAKKLPDNKEDLEFWAGYRMKWIKHHPWADPSTAPKENQTVLALTGMEEAPDIEVLDYDADTAKHIKWWMPIPAFPGKTRCDFDI